MPAAINSRRKVRLLRRLCEEQDGRCCYCGQIMLVYIPKRRPTLEHMLSLTLGGSNRYENLAAACFKCNSEQGTRLGQTLQRFRRFGGAVLRMDFPPALKVALIVAGVHAMIGELTT